MPNFSILKSKKWLILLTIIFVLMIVRMILPHFVKKFINKTLANIPDYYGQVSDVDIALYRGAYRIEGLYLRKIDATTDIDFLNFPDTDISIEWKSIFKGKIVSEILMTNPVVIYVKEDMSSSSESKGEDWTHALTELVPIAINHLEVNNGKVAFVEISTDPNIDLQLNAVYFSAQNLRNVIDKNGLLPSTFSGSATSIGNGNLNIDGKINLIKEVPDVDLALSIKDLSLPALNDLTSHYGSIDFEEGRLEMFSEIAIADSYLKGYSKLLMDETQFIGKDEGPIEKIWEGFVSIFDYLLQNKDTKKFAIKVPLEGDLSAVDSSPIPAIISIFRNAFVEAFKAEIDYEIEYEDAKQEAKSVKNKKEKWWKFWKKK